MTFPVWGDGSVGEALPTQAWGTRVLTPRSSESQMASAYLEFQQSCWGTRDESRRIPSSIGQLACAHNGKQQRPCLRQNGKQRLPPSAALWPPHHTRAFTHLSSHTQTHACVQAHMEDHISMKCVKNKLRGQIIVGNTAYLTLEIHRACRGSWEIAY